jgi:hypothetical protein
MAFSGLDDNYVPVSGFRELEKGRLNENDPLFTAGKVIVGEINSNNTFKGTPTTVVIDDDDLPNNVITDDIFIYDISTYTDGLAQIGKNYAANFELTYVPFKNSLWTNNKWSPSKTEWIIRNGVNNEVQNDKTDFSNPNKWFSATEPTNGNGAVRFTPADTSIEGNFGDSSLGAALAVFSIDESKILTTVINGSNGTMTIEIKTTGYPQDGDTASVYYYLDTDQPTNYGYTLLTDNMPQNTPTSYTIPSSTDENQNLILLLYQPGTGLIARKTFDSSTVGWGW